LWLLWWLLFRLTFSSGLVKLASGDPTWRNLSALAYHYETQPLPTPLAWYLHQLPAWYHRLEAIGMFAVELGAPWLIFAPRRLRLLGCAAMVGLQLLIAATGNYCFFNLLTITLCLLLLDDATWPGWFRRRLGQPPDRPTTPRRWRRWLTVTCTILIVAVTSVPLLGRAGVPRRWLSPLAAVHGWLEPFRTFNGYGLFAVMTVSRPELIIEGSRDGVVWEAYKFKYKAGDLTRAPPWVAPHQPRLDWQLWFAALSRWEQEPWLQSFCVRLLQGEPVVLRLLARNPFPEAPPAYLRVAVADYRFTDGATRRREGRWWRRESPGPYSPVLSLRSE